MNYAQSERILYSAPATKPLPADEGPPFVDQFGIDNPHLVRTHSYLRNDLPRHQAPPPIPAPVQVRPAPAPAPAPQAPWYPLVSDDYTADLELAHQLMQSDEENINADNLGLLSLEEVVAPMRNHPGLKFANAPSRARRAPHSQHRNSSSSRNRPSPHSSPATSSSRGFSLPLPPVEELKPFDGPTLRQSHSYPALVSQPHPLSHEQYIDGPVKTEVSEPEPAPPSPAPSIPSLSMPTAASEPPEPPQPESAPSSIPASGSKRPARATKRSPAPRRQVCETCGKKFQRPCQLTTHIRSHTGEQPHACPVCSRRFSVLSNCQRHVKLCQKRSAKVLTPGDEDTAPGTEPGPSSSSFLAFSEAATEETARRSSDVPIRPKLLSHGSGSGSSTLGLERSGSVGTVGETSAESSTGTSFSGPGAGPSGYSPVGTRPGFSPAYDESGPRSFEPPQTIYEEPNSEYAPSGSVGYGVNGSGSYDAGSGSYDTARAASSSYGTPNAGSVYESASTSNSGTFGQYTSGYNGASGVVYGQSSPAPGALEYGHYSHLSPSHVHVHPHPSPSHIHSSSPATYSAPLMMATPTTHTVPLMHDTTYASNAGIVSPSVPSSGMLSPVTPAPGMSASRSMPLMGGHQIPVSRSMARRSTMSGMASGYPAESIPRRQTIVPSISEPSMRATQPFVPSDPRSSFAPPESASQSFVFNRSPADVLNPTLQSGVKLENEEGGDVWTDNSARAGYDWTQSAGRYHPYGVGSVAAGSSGYSYSQQQRPSQSQVYAQLPDGRFTGQHESFKAEEPSDGYASGVAYNNSSSPYAMSQESAADTLKRPHEQYSDYPWPGTEARWNSQPGYNDRNQ